MQLKREKKWPRFTKDERFEARNQAVKASFEQIANRHPRWDVSAVIEAVADKFFLAEFTVEMILKERGNYSAC